MEFKIGDRVRLLRLIAYECGDGCCQWEYDAGQQGTVINVWPNQKQCRFSPDGLEYAWVLVDFEDIELVEVPC